jgi:hypothetical protein
MSTVGVVCNARLVIQSCLVYAGTSWLNSCMHSCLVEFLHAFLHVVVRKKA